MRVFCSAMALLFMVYAAVAFGSNKPLPLQIRPQTGTVALVFDDGPNPKATPQILQILKKYHIHATFFLIGSEAQKYPELVKEIIAAGNVVGSHSMTHKNLVGLSEEQLHYQIVESKKVLGKLTGTTIKCLRTPYVSQDSKVVSYAEKHGMTVVPIGLSSFDYEQPGVDKIAICTAKHARSGYIISLHDGPIVQNRQQTVKALPLLIEGILAKGLGFSTICR